MDIRHAFGSNSSNMIRGECFIFVQEKYPWYLYAIIGSFNRPRARPLQPVKHQLVSIIRIQTVPIATTRTLLCCLS